MLRLALGVLAAALACSPSSADDLAVWPVDPHVKVFKDLRPPEKPPAWALRAARDEFEPGQLAIRSERALSGVRVELSALRQAGGGGVIPAECLSWNFVGFIPLKKNTRQSEAVQVRAAPCEVPDPLLEDRSLDLPAGTTQPVWITIGVPKDAAPGVYRGQVKVIAGQQSREVPLELRVDAFSLPRERHLWVTNWFSLDNIARSHKVELWSEPFWAMLARYAENMGAHRQNVVLTPWNLIQVTRGPDDKLHFDFARFDRYVELFEKAGVADRIEISHPGHGQKGWGSPFVLSGVSALDRQTGKRVTLTPEQGLAPLLSALERHLDQRGWLARSMIHVADEPILTNLDSWLAASKFVHQAAPRLRRIEAIETSDCSGHLEIWVPQISHFDRWRAAYESHRPGNEFWYYICCNPYGNLYPNRFLDYPGSRVRVLHWLNFSEGLSGYLHWGLNYWGSDPFGVPGDRLPPGDTHVLYPGSKGPLNSIRWELQRESLEDFEYLHLLSAKTAALRARLGKKADWIVPDRQAMEFCRRVVPSIVQAELDPARIMAARREVADAIAALDAGPLLLVQTEPAAGAELREGPIAVEVRGIAEPGATVRVQGQATAVRPDGTFVSRHGPDRNGQLRVECEHAGQKEACVKWFTRRTGP